MVPDFKKLPQEQVTRLQVRMTRDLKRAVDHAVIDSGMTLEQWLNEMLIRQIQFTVPGTERPKS